ncbi:hypothetical protein [Streptomyces sp. NBC_01483]|uniref:hypothetical protein n=1 Tax=Streptomyces sp. NBC_01483 TaxID=2903883 RepID=UPI002E35A9DD|nr:hypothetical protein [Streptomyces sp. NBC_01483]
MTLTDTEMAALIAPAGLHFVQRRRDDVLLPPLPQGYSPASARPEHGRFDSHPDEIADVDAPDMADKINASWYRMATEYGLFDEDREFLLGVDYNTHSEDEGPQEDDWAWVRVRLLDGWDFVTSEVAQLRSGMATLFTTRFVPEFTAVSLDGRMMMNTTVWGNGTVSTIAIRP